MFQLDHHEFTRRNNARVHHNTSTLYRAERTMNQTTVDANVIEFEATDLQALATKHAQEIVELNFAQLALIGGGEASIIL